MDNLEEIRANSQVIVDGDVSIEKLRALIRRNGEESVLDYKLTYDLGGKKVTKDKLEIVRDIVGMANTQGGYIVLGIDEDKSTPHARYKLIGANPEHLKVLDITTLKDQIERYIAVSLDIQLVVHTLPEFEDKPFALIYVPESPIIPVVFEKHGQYVPEDSKHSVDIFKATEIVVRDGASTRTADQNAMRQIVSKMRRRERDHWTEEILVERPVDP